MGWGLIMTQVPLYHNTEFQYNIWSSFFQSPWKRRKYPHVTAWASRRSIQAPRLHSLLWVLFIKFVLQITLPPLNHYHCRQDNSPPLDLSLEPSSRARMCYHNCLKFCLYSIMKNLEIILRGGAKLRFSEVPQTSVQILHKILLIRTILMV